MERDFMGLNSKDTVVKEEILEGCKEPVFSKCSGLQWPLSNGFEANHQAGEIQSAHSLQLHHDSKQAVPVTMSSPFFRPHFAGAPVNPQLLGGVPVTSPFPVLPSTGSFVAPWYGFNDASAPAQLTIFYGGMVNVYDAISPEKAQAIMFLAGNGAFVAAANTPMTPARDAVYVSQPSPMSVSSHPANKEEATKTMGGSATPVAKMDFPRVMSSLGQVIQSAIPQARKASLVRFLKKRKERVMASIPYSLSKNPDCATSSDTVVISSERRV